MDEQANVFKQIETDEHAPESAKKFVISELEVIQNSTQVLELFASNYFNTLGLIFIND